MGVTFAHSLGCVLGVPVCGVNHLRGHAYSPFMDAGPAVLADACPHLGLLVSGGNTLLFEILAPGHLRVLGRTRDDAAGEALDKGARLLGLPYPGGPAIQAHAQCGDAQRYAFPRGLCKDSGYDFSFSGLKTALRYTLEKMTPSECQQALADLCASYQQAVVDALVHKVTQALVHGSYRSLGLSGGVAHNRLLRQALGQLAQREGLAFWPAQPAHCGDNASMIAFAAYVDPGHTVPAVGSRLPVASSWTLDGTVAPLPELGSA
jgi:N6-L-threonylcarbamoyladenine synthase